MQQEEMQYESMYLLSNKAETEKTYCGKAMSKSLVILCMDVSGLAEFKPKRAEKFWKCWTWL